MHTKQDTTVDIPVTDIWHFHSYKVILAQKKSVEVFKGFKSDECKPTGS